MEHLMEETHVLLATLAQSAAAMVAIIGGFLVSRLVALSSEREGLRRQRVMATAHLTAVTTEYEAAHEFRLENSKADFEEWVLDDMIKGAFDEEVLLEDNVPRGSSEAEMRPVLNDLIARVNRAYVDVRSWLTDGDNDQVDLDDLIARGLLVPPDDREIYERVLYQIRTRELPSVRNFGTGILFPIMPPFSPVDPGGTSARRLDESIRDEQTLLSRRVGLQQEIARLGEELERIGRPAGVTSAIVILSIYALLGIAAPLAVMVAHPTEIAPWAEWLLLAAFLIGLASVLIYVYWYARTLNRSSIE